MKKITVLIIFLAALTWAQAMPLYFVKPPKHEVRAVWLTTIGGLDWPHSYARSESSRKRQQQELCTMLDQLHEAGVNTVLLQTRVRGTVIYPSSMETWDGCLSGNPGVSPGYDALEFAVNECHKRGMELHAWVVTMPVGKWNGHGCRNLRSRYPQIVKRIGDEGYMNPEKEQTADYLARICGEIADNYDVDGIHLDYIRYPEQWPVRVKAEKGRANITYIVQKIYNKVKERKPWVKLSCSPIGKHDDLTRYWSHGWNARSRVMQDAQEWLRLGLMDQIYPMMYFDGNQFYPFALDWMESSYGRTVVPGLGIYFMSPKEKNWPLCAITRQMEVVRSLGMGHAYFRSRFFTDDMKGLYSFALVFDGIPALVPAMTWQHATPPDEPRQLQLDLTHYKLYWQAPTDNGGSPYLTYNVYASREWPVDIDDPRNIVATGLRATEIGYVSGQNYAITAMDRYGNESKPLIFKKITRKTFVGK